MVAIIGSAITLAIGGSVKSDTIRIVDVSSSMYSPYGELNASSAVGYNDNFSGWTPSQNTQVNANSLVFTGSFQNASTWAAISLFKSANVNITSYPIFSANIDLTTGVRYGIRFFAQYPNGTEYDVWWEGSPLDHRPGMGHESLRVNMQREAFLATGHAVSVINKLELYIEDPPYSPASFQFTLSRLAFEVDSLQQISANQYRAIYFDLNNPPEENASWSLNKINLGVTVQANPGSIFSIYFFDGPILYGSTTTAGESYNSLTSYTEYTFYPNLQPQIFPELLPLSNSSIVFVATTGALKTVTVQFANFEFLPTTTNPDLMQQSLGLYYVYFIFFLFLLPIGISILVFREFISRKSAPRPNVVAVLIAGILCRIALAATTAHVFDMNVYLASIRGWFQFRTTVGSLGPTLPFTFFLYWIFYSPYGLLQLAGFQDFQFLGHAAGIVESVFVKLFPMTMDITTFFLLLRFRKDGATFVWATFYFLNPLSIFMSSVWGQYEAATVALIVWGTYWISKKKTTVAAFAFVTSGMVELLGFFPYGLLVLRTIRLKLYRSVLFAILAALPLVLYPPETELIFRLFLGFTGFLKSGVSQPGRFTLLGNFPQLSLITQLRPLLISELILLPALMLDIYRQKLTVEKLLFYTIVSSIFSVLFSGALASWLWLLPLCLLYTIMKDKYDLGAFVLVFGTTVAFLEVAYAFSSAYLIFGIPGYSILPAIEGITNRLKIFSIMVTSLSVILLLLLKYGSGQAGKTILRTSGIVLSIYLLLYFWFGVYPV